MSIQNELSSDIAVALLTRKQTDPEKLNDLKETVLRIHSMLQRETVEWHLKRVHAQAANRLGVPNRKTQ